MIQSTNWTPLARKNAVQDLTEKKTAVTAIGRVIQLVCEVSRFLYELILKIIRAVIGFFFSSSVNKANAQTDEKTILNKLQDHAYLSEQDPEKLASTLHEVLRHPEEIAPETKASLQKFVAHTAKCSETANLSYKEAYYDSLKVLDEVQLRNYVRLLATTGKPAPLHYFFTKHHQAAGLTGDSNILYMQKRLETIFTALTLEQVEALHNFDHFWVLIHIIPTAAASHLDADKLTILAKNKTRFNKEMKKLISRLPEDDHLHLKLRVLVPHATEETDLRLTAKVERLVNFHFRINGREVSTEEKQVLKAKLNRKIKKAVKKDKLEKARIAEEKKKTENGSVSSTPKRKWETAFDRKDSKKNNSTPVAVQPKPQWSGEQCLNYLKNQEYKENETRESQEIIFDWILKQDSSSNEELSSQIQSYLEYLFAKPFYMEEMLLKLYRIDMEQLRSFVKLLGRDKIGLLWTLEAKKVTAGTEEENKYLRLRVEVPSLTEEQLIASTESEKFFELMRVHPQLMGTTLTSNQLKVIADKTERKTDVLNSFTPMVSKMTKDSDALFEEKLQIMAALVIPQTDDQEEALNLRKALKEEISKKVIQCSASAKKIIAAMIK